MSVSWTASPDFFLFSSAHCSFAPSIWRRLLMQALRCAVWRARTKFGIAIAARRPMMATTIIISTNVKPPLREVLIFILLFLSCNGREHGRGGLILVRCAFTKSPTTDRGHVEQSECHGKT